MEDFDLEFERDEMVIIRSAEVEGVVRHFCVNTLDASVYYWVIFPYGSVYTEGNGYKGYSSSCGWFLGHQLRKIKSEENKSHVWTINLEDVIHRMIDKNKKIADALNPDILNQGRR